MSEYKRPRAIWLREERDACDRVHEGRTSDGNRNSAKQNPDGSDMKRK